MGRLSVEYVVVLLVTVLVTVSTTAYAIEPRKTIEGGEFAPLYGVSSERDRLTVPSFRLDVYPVTNIQFKKFVEQHQEWKPGHRNPLLADAKYLQHWCTSSTGKIPCDKDRDHPVTNISWFAAVDYCAAQGGRVPTVLEWEYVAAADRVKKDASRDPEFVQQLLSWYSRPTTSLKNVGMHPANVWGIHDLQGLVWEWTQDFNSIFVAGDNRRDGEKLNNLFCGSGAVSSSDRANYAAFMRYALRNSLRGSYTLENLGFRCAYDSLKD